MAKCIRCGGSLLLRGKVKLADAEICGKCYRELGFDVDQSGLLTARSTKWADMKDGKAEYDRRRWAKRKAEFAKAEAERLGLFYSDYATLDALECLDNEMKAVERVCALLEDEGCNSRKITYERDPGCPLGAFMGDEMLYQLRYTKDVKWIRIGPDGEKKMISGPAGINKLAPKLVERYNSIK